MPKRYEIELHVKDGSSAAALASQSAALDKVQRKYKAVGDSQEQAAQKTADAQAKAAQKAADAQTKQAERAAQAQTRAAQKAADQVTREADRSAAAQARAAQKAATAQTKAAERAFNSSFVSSLKLGEQAEKLSSKLTAEADRQAKAKLTAEERAQARLTAMAGRALTDQEVTAKAAGNIHQRFNDKRVEAATKVAEAERRAALGIQGRLKESFGSFIETINPAAIAMTGGLAAVGFGLAALREKWADVAKATAESVKVTDEYRTSLLETAALKGRLGDTTTEAKESLTLRSKTLQTRDQARQFEEGFLNTGQASIGRRIMQDEADKLKIGGGAFQAAEGGNATTHGELLGRLPALMKLDRDKAGKEIPLKADQVLGEEQRVFGALQLGGSSFSSGAAQLLKNSSLTSSGLYGSIGQQAGLQSMFSLNAPESAGDLVNQFTRATVGNLGRMRGVGVEGSIKTGEYLKGLNATNQMDPVEIGKLISTDLSKQEKVEASAGRKFNAYDYLKHQGYGNQEEVQSLLQFHASQSSGEYAKFEQAGTAAPDAKAMRDKLAGFRVDPVGQRRLQEVTHDMAQFSYGANPGTTDRLQRAAFDRLLAKKEISGTYEQNWNSINPLMTDKIVHESSSILEESAARRGVKVDVPKMYVPWQSDVSRGQQYQEAMNKIQSAGGDPLAETNQQVRQIVERQLQSQIEQEKLARNAAAKQAETNRLLAQIAARQGPPAPLPAQGPGRIPPR